MPKSSKTKIIATLGDPGPDINTYDQGVFDTKLKKIHSLDLESLIMLLANSHWPDQKSRSSNSGIGVDVLRLNLAHLGEGCSDDEQKKVVRAKFREVKKAILAVEKRIGRRLSLLTDLPGPKIRINAEDWLLPTNELIITFADEEETVSREADSIPNFSVVKVNIGTKEPSDRVADDILTDVQKRCQERNAEPLLAYIGDSDCTLIIKRCDVKKRRIICKVHDFKRLDRVIGRRKGFTIRGIPKRISAFTNEDVIKLTAVLDEDLHGYTGDEDSDSRVLAFVGISFCQSRDDVLDVLLHMQKTMRGHYAFSEASVGHILNEAPLLIAKIETQKGVESIDEILDLADGAMIARGDLALEAPITKLPHLSKKVINACHIRGKPAIIATQMLESMKNSIECTRPEANDVFNAVIDGVDALMMSGETSTGKYPAHAIRKMRDLAQEAEIFKEESTTESTYRQEYALQLKSFNEVTKRVQNYWISHILKDYQEKYTKKILRLRHHRDKESKDRRNRLKEDLEIIQKIATIKEDRLARQNSTDRISHAACLMSADDDVKGIVAPSKSGRTVRMLARFRPKHWIYAQPNSQLVARKMTIIWGVLVNGILAVKKDSFDVHGLMRDSASLIREEKDVEDGPVIFTCGTPLGHVGVTNLVQRWDPLMMKILCEKTDLAAASEELVNGD